MQLSQALNPRRIARSLVTVILLTFVQVVVAPIVVPKVSAPEAVAVTATITPTSNSAGTSIVIPSGVSSVTIEAIGGAGGKGGDDGNAGTSGTVAGRVITTIAVSPGDVLGLYGGNKGAAGANSAIGNGGGAGGADTLPTAAYSIAGTYFWQPDFAGGTGGAAGSQGSSGGGGGAGAASIATLNYEIVVIAAGAGGGGGAGNGTNYAGTWNGTLAYNGTNFSGSNGQGLAAANSCPGASNNNGDGGGGGGGGGGYYGGAGALAPLRVGECSGNQGSPGGNYVATRATTSTNDRTSQTAEGYVKYTYNFDSVSTCSKSTSTFDIYTIESITTTGQCTWTVPASVSVIDLFLVGGGGGGGGDGGGGGGGGAALSRTAIAVSPNSTMTLKAGYGGVGGAWGAPITAGAGESTTVQLATGTLFSALGGSAAAGGWSATPGSGGTASNGGFAGGAGGSASTSTAGSIGSAGKTGISNYYTGVKIEYGGGGGGGINTNNVATTAAAGASGGGAGAYAASSSLNIPGADGTNGLGGGGGGGVSVSAGTGIRVNGGKGGSGVILIRYATNSADAFPSTIAPSLSGRWTPNQLQVLDSGRQGWIDSAGGNATGAVSGAPTVAYLSGMDAGTATGASKTNLVASGSSTAVAALVSGTLSNYTIFHIARYPTGATTKGRAIAASGNNYVTGLYNGSDAGMAYHVSGFITPQPYSLNNKWLLSTDMVKLYRANGKDVSYKSDVGGAPTASGPNNFGINNYTNEPSQWQMLDVLIFNRQLLNGEIRAMEIYLARIYGLGLDIDITTSDTDTASTMGVNNSYYFNSLGAGNTLNDTFTIEAWIKPSASCDGSVAICQVVSKESTVLFGIQGGVLYWSLNGGTVGGSTLWTTTGVKVKSGEWHHVAMVKQFTGDKNGSLLFYLDGQLAYTVTGSPYGSVASNFNSTSASYAVSDGDTNWWIIAGRSDTQKFIGEFDEFKVWKVARSASEVALDMRSNDSTSASMQMYYDFNKNSLSYADPSDSTVTPLITNLAYGGVARSDLYTYYASNFSLVEVRSTNGPYSVVTFPRTIITQRGGWAVPDSVTSTTILVVGGGGGGAGAYTSNLAAAGGGGGGGGVFGSPTPINLTSLRTVPITVGAGGLCGPASATASAAAGSTGQTSYFSVLSAGGGGAGGYVTSTNANGLNGTSGGGGGGASNYLNAYNSGAGGNSQPTVFAGETFQGFDGGYGAIFNATYSATGDAGAGGGASLSASRIAVGGGISSAISGTQTSYGRGGGAKGVTGWSFAEVGANLGTGGSGQYGSSAAGGNGSSGVVIVRWITASKPIFTPPTNAYLNVGMTETFTTNVAQDSATSLLTRTFRWESSTTGANGTFTPIKTGTGAANASFSWVPTDTSTSGNQYVYRVVVTDSDVQGLYITDTSSAVYAVINGTLTMTGLTGIKKTINVARNETYTVLAGTSTYRYTLSPTIAGITLDTSTAMSPVIKISETATVGTYYETLTVTDSVTASVVIPLTITISAPPTLTNTGEVITNGQVFAIDASNSASYNPVTGAWSDISGNKKVVSVNASAGTSPTYSSDYSGVVTLNNANYQALYTTGIGKLNTWTIDSWVRLDSALSAQACVVNTEYVNTNINYYLCFDTTRTVFAGFYIYNSYTYMRTTTQVPLNTWAHIVGTWNGVTAKVYINGTLAAGTEIYENAGTSAPAPDGTKTYIGKWWDAGFQTAASSYTPMTIGSIRLYNVALVDTQIALNYSATKDRFLSINQSQITPTQKYGALNIESFTVTSGGDTKTVSFAIGNRTGIKWDTATAGLIKLSVQESITPGTYYDTITVTDNFSQSTYLPIKFTINKADTITVTAGAATTQVYNKTQATLIPNFAISGFVSSDTGTVQRKYTGVDWTKPCASGGGCEVGDTGPGGGTIFYISPTVIDSATGISSGGKYLEVAPLNWSGLGVESTTAWAKAQTSVAGTSSAIGTGAENTRLINNALTTNSVAAKVAADLVLNGKSDWFLPSTLEVKEMYDALYLPSLAGNLSVRNYWSSTQGATTSQADTYWFGNGGLISPTDKLNSFVLRPIRAYSPDTITVTTVPTNVDSYTVTVDTITTTSGSLSYYENVIFQSSGLDITKARQEPLSVTSYVATFGSSYTLTVLGGSGSGASTETLTAASIAQGCSLTGHVMTTTTQGSCTIQVKKAYSRNYFTETTTAQVYFLVWATNQPTGVVGSGPTIGLSGETGIIRDPNQAPTISSLSVYTAQAGVTQIIITGAGFNHLDTSTVVVKFWRNKVASGFTVSNDDTQITVTVPTGTTTGKVMVTTPNGIAVSEFALTITP